MGLEKDLILLFTYVSPERSVIYETGNGNGIDILNNKITAILSDFPDVAFLLAGDFNARTKNLDDYIPSDDIDYIFQCNTAYPCDSFCMPRNSKDKVLNRFGSALIDLMMYTYLTAGCTVIRMDTIHAPQMTVKALSIM